MKKILILCAAAAMTLACNKNETPSYGDDAIVATPQEAQEALNQGSNNITITDPLAADASLMIPASYASTETVTITIPANNQSLTVTEGSGDHLPALNLVVDGANNVTIETPDMSVTFDGSVSGTLTASTAENTLTIAEGATVNSLVVNKGNVRLLGTVTTFTDIDEGSRILYPVATAAELRERTMVEAYDQITNGGVFLTADVADVIPSDGSLGGITASQANQDLFSIGLAPTLESDLSWDNFVLDGNGHSISGAAYNNVLAVYSDNVVVQNLTVLQTADQKSAKIEKNGALESANNNGISVYEAVNVSLTNVTAKECGKYGAVVNAAKVTAANFTSSANGWGGINVDMGTGTTTTPELNLVSATITDAKAVVVDYPESVVTVPTGWTSVTEGDVTIYSPPAAM